MNSPNNIKSVSNNTESGLSTIELGLSTIELGLSNNNTIAIQVNQQNSHNNIKEILIVKSVLILYFIIVGMPLAFCDLYYGYTDNSCVSNNTDKLSIDLKDYLIISGWLTSSLLFVIINGIICFNDSTSEFIALFGIIIFVLSALFNISWNIIGGVIFWSYMDNSKCSSSIYNYVFASLIIKYVFTFIGIYNSISSKDH
jgi:hypothetical protein